jgi:hypothetical protein
MWSSFSSWRRSSPGALVQLSSERARQALRQDCSFAKTQKSPPALLVVVRSESLPGTAGTPASSRSGERRRVGLASLTGPLNGRVLRESSRLTGPKRP